MLAAMRRKRLLAIATLLLVAGCPRPVPPVLEELSLDFDGAGRATAHIVSRLDEGEEESSRREAADYRDRVDRGDDPWRSSVTEAKPKRDRLVVDRVKGKLVRVERRLEIALPAGVEALFRDDAVRASFVVEGRRATLALVPAGSLARGDEARQVEAAKAELVQRVSSYLEATAAIYRFIDDHPEVRTPVLGALFDDLLSDEDKALHKDFEGDEVPGLDKLGDAWSEADQALQKYLYEEPEKAKPAFAWLSRRAYHPLRARLSVRVTGEVEEVQGFVAHGAGQSYELPEFSFLAAIERATRGVVEPLPILDLAAHAVAEGGTSTVPLANLVARKLVANPVPPDLADRIERELRPESIYQIRWLLPEDAAARP